MFRNLFSPLRSRFEIQPRPSPTPTSLNYTVNASDDEAIAPEDFARDVLIQLMRNYIEDLKAADEIKLKAEILSEIHKIMLQDVYLKDVFCEMDGFPILMSTLSTITTPRTPPQDQSESETSDSVREIAGLVFMILSEAMHECPANEEYFTTHLGFECLNEAILFLISDPSSIDQTVGFLFSLALHDFSMSNIFVTLRSLGPDYNQLDAHVFQLCPRLGIIRNAGAIQLLWNVLPRLGARDDTLKHGSYVLLELLAELDHRNLAILGNLGLLKPISEKLWAPEEDKLADEKEHCVLVNLLKRFLDMGATTPEVRWLFQKAVKQDNTLDEEIIGIISDAMRSRWPGHFSMDGQAALVVEDSMRGLPSSGFTFMIWLRFERIPSVIYNIFQVASSTKSSVLSLRIRPDGTLEFQSTGHRDVAPLPKICIAPSRWTHIAIVHHPRWPSNPTIRFFIDGVLKETLHWQYPRHEPVGEPGLYILGDTVKSNASWCIASAYLLSLPLPNDYPRLVHHLGPRYCGNFQDPLLFKFLTYEASTSLSVFLASLKTGNPFSREVSPLTTAVRDGLGINEVSILFALSPASVLSQQRTPSAITNTPRTPSGPFASGHLVRGMWRTEGDVLLVDVKCLDGAFWMIGGAALGLHLVQLSRTANELAHTLSILLDGIRNSWRNSEDMERLRGYDILGDILRAKTPLIDMTVLEILFDFLGLSLRAPERSTIVNTVAYRAIALDFELWARTQTEVQRTHLQHFSMLLETSQLRKFNVRQRIAKMGVIRKLLFALQIDWYSQDTMQLLVDMLKVVAQAHFSANDTIKPIVSYLAANLHDCDLEETPGSPSSVVERKQSREKAIQVMDALISLLVTPTLYNKFSVSLPLARVYLLLLGDKPSSVIASQVLLLIGISLNASPSFSRKFELVSGWSVLKNVLPSAWDPSVHDIAFDILLGRVGMDKSEPTNKLAISCPHIMPAVLAALDTGLLAFASDINASKGSAQNGDAEASRRSMSSIVEVLIEDLIDLQASCPSFRQIFKSQLLTKQFIDAYQSFVSTVSPSSPLDGIGVRILDKITHFGLSLALDPEVASGQQREILDVLRETETKLRTRAAKTSLDPSDIIDVSPASRNRGQARLSTQVGERTLLKAMMRTHDWRKAITIAERKQLRKFALDLQENRQQILRLNDWTLVFTSERGLWAHPNKKRMWRLDETEGPHRIRKKMEPQDEPIVNFRVENHDEEWQVEPDSDSQSIVQVERPPWAEQYEITVTEAEDDQQLAEEVIEDKHRRVRHQLEPGDVIEAINTVARIDGVDSSPGLLIMGQTHLYMLDGLVEDDHGEVISAQDAPRQLFFVPGSVVELNGPQKAQRWTYDQVTSLSNRMFLFRDVALELYFKDSRSLLIVFLDKKSRRDLHYRLSTLISREQSREVRTPGLLMTPLLGARLLMGFRADELSTAQRKWQTREISTYTYLSILNQISGRTPSDATQYPVFPWVLKDYSSHELDLKSEEVYRDLTKPMGALTAARREAAEMRYMNLQSVEENPFHYGTHFSSSMIVCHFMIRLAPFTRMFKTLQGGDWDLPDRLFLDIGRAYESASQDVRGDVRELIPEFFTCPEFLENSANLDFGVQQNTGEKIHDVKLPPWAKQDPLLFVNLNRQALESEFVSAHLPAWIDLIWGCKQRDAEALNVFHPLSYEGSIDLDNITDELEREATVGIIHNFGQTPRKLFPMPHPPRFMNGPHTLPLGGVHGIAEEPHLLLQGSKMLKDLGTGNEVRDLIIDSVSGRIVPCPEGVLCSPARIYEHVHFGPRTHGGELRMLVDGKVVQVVEAALCVCAAWADATSLVTGSSDHAVRIWRLSPTTRLTISHVMRVHGDEVVSIAASRPWSLVVSGSKDGSAAIWDLNKGAYVRSIWHTNAQQKPNAVVHLVAINESTGHIATCSRTKLCLHTINARPIATLDLLSPSPLMPPPILSLAFHEREYSHTGVIATGGPDGVITLRTWNTDKTPPGAKAYWDFVVLRTMKVRNYGTDGSARVPSVTALKFIGEALCHGEDTGKTFLWTLPD